MKIRLTKYSSIWISMFEEEAFLLKNLFNGEIVSIEHFGSTAVPGMSAKPVIDMMCIVNDINNIDTYNKQMNKQGYDVAGEWGIEGRRLFRKGGENRTHHIHFYQYDNPEIWRHLVFRDYLLSHPEEVKRYTQYKEMLAKKYEYTSDYSPAKKGFVAEMEKKALAWWKGERG
ncbi:GrpB family protein [Gracilibacillus oryzae]|uniref:GrpB family protein n=1 Tax=Gracilibacillus oryzae TaxID=1672701 RepID=A0A7C8L7V7_9BACI|nr:GrpB family protein [Gracilibacillus oryzae]KAB8137752.1 GrpB family protein [Gracilibacillus oryzae]